MLQHRNPAGWMPLLKRIEYIGRIYLYAIPRDSNREARISFHPRKLFFNHRWISIFRREDFPRRPLRHSPPKPRRFTTLASKPRLQPLRRKPGPCRVTPRDIYDLVEGAFSDRRPVARCIAPQTDVTHVA